MTDIASVAGSWDLDQPDHAPKAHVALVGYGRPHGRQQADAGRH